MQVTQKHHQMDSQRVCNSQNRIDVTVWSDTSVGGDRNNKFGFSFLLVRQLDREALLQGRPQKIAGLHIKRAASNELLPFDSEISTVELAFRGKSELHAIVHGLEWAAKAPLQNSDIQSWESKSFKDTVAPSLGDPAMLTITRQYGYDLDGYGAFSKDDTLMRIAIDSDFGLEATFDDDESLDDVIFIEIECADGSLFRKALALAGSMLRDIVSSQGIVLS